MKFGNFLFPDSRDPERDGIVIDETLREAWLSDELGVDAIWLAEHHFDGICAYADPIAFAGALATSTRHSKIGFAVLQMALHHPIRLSQRGPRRWGVTGTPGDCVVMALSHLMRGMPPQLLLSGVNRGANLGIETVFSGTVGGAMTGMMLGVPSIALSQAWTDRAQIRWETAAALGPQIVRRLWDIGWGIATCLSVNFPDLPAGEAGPLTLARQGAGSVEGMDVEVRTDPRGLTYYWVKFRRGERDQGRESDISALNAGRVVVTPLRYDRTDEAAYALLSRALPRRDEE